ncbi:hypothetical protein O9G_004972 [Rozella allomycis CSF55]|uniref:4a-hydroxytetrahydrobiopterin dehydratase n=1 Tax=Rozella allomycis (strain CSF55) TaxID=988480 RepID=A0A075AML3_ROZAC|nr:hypothetical protein O9G_004972 [Rozella allomycis CSF55]|eukprot:EPZ30876.1 hypothetical protein O9G_004972 [Rozella allomycis CSF55]
MKEKFRITNMSILLIPSFFTIAGPKVAIFFRLRILLIAMQKDEIAKLVSLGWKQLSNDKKLQKEFVFKNFVHAFKFMTLIAEKAEQVDIVWTTHDAQQLTEKDITMAQLCDKLHAETVNSIN